MPNPTTAAEWAEEALKGAMIPGGSDIVALYHARVVRAIKDYAVQQVREALEEAKQRVDRIFTREHNADPDDKHDGQEVAAEISDALLLTRELRHDEETP